MTVETFDILQFYRVPGVMTDPGEHAELLAGLPGDLHALVQAVQGNLLHVFWAQRYGVELSDADRGAVMLRQLERKLAAIHNRDEQPLTVSRPLEQRLVGNCRDFTVTLTGLLQHLGIPARARCGFATYFIPGHFEDHWVCEYWNAGQARWVLVDAQLDDLQRQALQISFDPLDVPRDRFLTAGLAWQMCRQGQADPQNFGIMEYQGWWFVWGNMVRDFLALNKVEILPWDGGWGYLTTPLEAPPPAGEQVVFYDRIAELTLAPDTRFAEVRQTYLNDECWQVPKEVLGSPG